MATAQTDADYAYTQKLLQQEWKDAETDENDKFQHNKGAYLRMFAVKWAATPPYNRMEVPPIAWIRETAALHIRMFRDTNIVPARFRGNDVDAETVALIDYAVKDLTWDRFC